MKHLLLASCHLFAQFMNSSGLCLFYALLKALRCLFLLLFEFWWEIASLFFLKEVFVFLKENYQKSIVCGIGNNIEQVLRSSGNGEVRCFKDYICMSVYMFMDYYKKLLQRILIFKENPVISTESQSPSIIWLF